MRNLLLTLALISASAWAQTISGIVVDEKGAPLAGVLVAHVVVAWRPFLTDANGAFSVSPRGNAVVFRKKGYDSKFVRIGAQRDFRIELHPTTEHELPSCDKKSRCAKFEGGGGTLCFPTPAKVSTKLETGIDGATIIYQTPSGQRALHGIGTSWSFGPSSADVWKSTEYREIAYSGSIIDARGVTEDGKRWRFFGIIPGPGTFLLESMEYHNLDEASAAVFDQAIDGVCVIH